MVEALGGAALMMATVALVSLVCGFVLLRIGSAFLVDQTLDGAEAAGLVIVLVAVLALTLKLWGSPLMILPGLIAALVVAVVARASAARDRRAEATHRSAAEDKARAMIERDPTALLAYERLADLLESDGRWAETVEVLEEWHRRAPDDGALSRRLERAKSRADAVARPAAL